MLNPELDSLDSELAPETFIEFESGIHRIARLEFVKRLGGEPRGGLRLNSLPEIVAAATEGAGICYAPEHHLTQPLATG